MTQIFKDLVCDMKVNPQHAAASIQYQGQTYYFCSQLCKAIFEREPGKYVKNAEAER